MITVVIGVLLLAYAAGGLAIFWAMHQPPEVFGNFMKRTPLPVAFMMYPFEPMWMQARAGHLAAGDPAPDFSLAKLDKSGQVRLSELNRDKPVVLIFGSYT